MVHLNGFSYEPIIAVLHFVVISGRTVLKVAIDKIYIKVSYLLIFTLVLIVNRERLLSTIKNLI